VALHLKSDKPKKKKRRKHRSASQKRKIRSTENNAAPLVAEVDAQGKVACHVLADTEYLSMYLLVLSSFKILRSNFLNHFFSLEI